MLNKEEREHIRQLILQKIERAEKDIVELRELTRPIAPENAIGRISRMDAINNKSVNEAALRKTEEQLAGLQLALSSIDKESFGICIRCKKPIPAGRLLLMPGSSKCTHCA